MLTGKPVSSFPVSEARLSGNHLNAVAAAIEPVRIHERLQKYFPNTLQLSHGYPNDSSKEMAQLNRLIALCDH